MRALFVLVAVTAVWGVTFVQVKDAVALYPLFTFLAVRFAIAGATLAAPAASRVRSLGQRGLLAAAFAGGLLGTGYALQTAGLERTTVSSTGFITGLYVVLTPLIALGLFHAYGVERTPLMKNQALRRLSAGVALMVWLLVMAASTWNAVERPLNPADVHRLDPRQK